jgi:LytS/YehU family sensor histidine kinase
MDSLQAFYPLLVSVALYFLIEYMLEFQAQKEKTLKALTLAQQAQLQMLRYQLNPHFLFNTLNSIRAMVVVDQTKARDMITQLSEFIRYSLVGNKMEHVTISKEIEAINNYLDIQKIRFGERLEVKLEISPEANNQKIPCFLIHPLVENAVKYGIETSPVPLRIEISAAKTGQQLMIKVSNTGKLVEPTANDKNGTGTGLNNIKQRLQHLYPDRYEFKFYQDNGWVHAEITIQIQD